MVSVLIPSFDWDVSALARELHRQFALCAVPFEIIISDNASNSPYEAINQQLNELPNCHYLLEHTEVGRSANRNALAQRAKFPWLLFLDGDTAIPHPDFVQRYLDHLSAAPVICGGTTYQQHKPVNPQKLLRWRYGKTKEEVTAALRSRAPYRAYSSFNFMIQKDLFFKIGFDERLKQYGHEDTLFGRELKIMGVHILHINNPLLHLGLDDAADFLEKTLLGVENLYNLACTGRIDPEVRLYAWYQTCVDYNLAGLIARVFKQFKKAVEKQLTRANPYIWLFDFYKLGHLCTLHSFHKGLPIRNSL
jgi:glycosyltransferase involved in cell wall biosynthesis